jgi:galactokinase
LIDSHVPPAAGVSSSSAFTVCAAVVTMHANNMHLTIPKGDLSKMCVAAERLAGTACGGMDQTISIFAELNKAKLIESTWHTFCVPGETIMPSSDPHLAPLVLHL